MKSSELARQADLLALQRRKVRLSGAEAWLTVDPDPETSGLPLDSYGFGMDLTAAKAYEIERLSVRHVGTGQSSTLYLNVWEYAGTPDARGAQRQYAFVDATAALTIPATPAGVAAWYDFTLPESVRLITRTALMGAQSFLAFSWYAENAAGQAVSIWPQRPTPFAPVSVAPYTASYQHHLGNIGPITTTGARLRLLGAVDLGSDVEGILPLAQVQLLDEFSFSSAPQSLAAGANVVLSIPIPHHRLYGVLLGLSGLVGSDSARVELLGTADLTDVQYKADFNASISQDNAQAWRYRDRALSKTLRLRLSNTGAAALTASVSVKAEPF